MVITMTDEMSHSERVDKVLEENRRALYIGRVRRETRELFKKIAEEDFENDYGLLLDHIFWQWYDSRRGKDISDINKKIDALVGWIHELESKPDEKKPKKAINGQLIERGENYERRTT